jgi:hypothetical protein
MPTLNLFVNYFKEELNYAMNAPMITCILLLLMFFFMKFIYHKEIKNLATTIKLLKEQIVFTEKQNKENKKIDKYNYRVNLIKEWRTFIEQFDFANHNFGNTTIYASMRPHMREETIKKLEAKRTYYACSDTGRGADLFKQWLSDEVSAIERKWGLI